MSIRPTPDQDAEFVRRTLDGDRTAFDQLLNKYQRQAFAVAYRLLGNTDDAMEVTQDAFTKTYTSLGTLRTPEAFGGWLLRTVSNLSLNRRRGRGLRKTVQEEASFGGDLTDVGAPIGGGEWMAKSQDPADGPTGRELGHRIEAALASLPERQRLAIVLFTIEQLPQKQIAQTLGCSVEAVKWHVFQGRKKLKELLKDYL